MTDDNWIQWAIRPAFNRGVNCGEMLCLWKILDSCPSDGMSIPILSLYWLGLFLGNSTSLVQAFKTPR